MLNLFYKACRFLTYVIIIFTIILILSKVLPLASDVADKIIHGIKNIFNNLQSILKNITR